jgi:hypothetical protein
MGLAAQHSGGQLRLGVSATVASGVLYGAVILLGLGPASPSAQGHEADRSSPVVWVPRDQAVSRPGSRLPQVSSGRARRHSVQRLRTQPERATTVTAEAAGPTSSGNSSPAAPLTPEPKPKTTSSTSVLESTPPPTTTTTTTPSDPDPIVTVPTVTVPDLPVTVPTSPVPLPPVPAVPTAPTVPSVPLP